MTRYRALVVSSSGRQSWEEVEAESRSAAAARLSRDGFVPLDIRDGSAGWRTKLTEPVVLSRRVGLGEQALMLTQLAMLLRFGLPVDRSLDLLREQASRGSLQDMLGRMVKHLRSGDSLAQAFNHAGIFPAYVVGVVRSSERTGKLAEAVQLLGEQLTAAASARRQLITALTYPALVLVSTIIALFIVLTMVVPQFAPIFAGEEEKLPTLTLWVLWMADVVQRWGWVLLALGTILVLAIIWMVQHRDSSPLLASFEPHLPFRQLRRQYKGGQLLGVLGTLLSSGVTVVDALPLTAGASGSLVWRTYLERSEKAVRSGSSLSRALSTEALLPPTAIRLMEVGERGGSLGVTCLQASQIMAEAARARIDRVLSLANPLSILILGVLVAALVAGVMLGIFSLGDFVG